MSLMWSRCPCVTRIRSTLPSAARSLYLAGVRGFVVRNGSMTITLPVVLVMRNAEWPSHSTSVCCAEANTENIQSATPVIARLTQAIGTLRVGSGADGTPKTALLQLRPRQLDIEPLHRVHGLALGRLFVELGRLIELSLAAKQDQPVRVLDARDRRLGIELDRLLIVLQRRVFLGAIGDPRHQSSYFGDHL